MNRPGDTDNLIRPAPSGAVEKPFPDLSPLFIVLAAGLVISAIVFSPMLVYGPNDASRWDTVYALLKRGSYELAADDVPWRPVKIADISKPQDIPPLPTIDLVKINGKYYSSKPPLLPTCVAGAAWLIEKASGRDFTNHPLFIMRATLIVAQLIPLLLCLVLLRGYLRRWSGSAFVGNFCMAAAALGTYLTPWTVTFNNHVSGACLAMFTLHVVLRILVDGRREWYRFALAGFLAAFTAAVELPAALLAVGIFFALLIKEPRRTLGAVTPAALVVVAAAVYTNYLAFGTIEPVYLHVNEADGPYRFEGSYWCVPVGIDALREPKATYLLHMLIGHHGIFLLTPIFILSFLGMILSLWRDAGHRRRLAAGVLLLSGAVTLFYAGQTSNYGGACQGLRWLFWLIPLWLLFLPRGVEPLAGYRWGRGLCYALLLFSAANAVAAFPQPWTSSWVQRCFHDFGWINY